MSICNLARPEIRQMRPYDAPTIATSWSRLNANEAAEFPYQLSGSGDVNRYPEMRPHKLSEAIAECFGITANCVCPTRGSSEGIDLLIRTFCRAYTDNIVILPPTFEMYSVYARMQAAEVREVPLLSEDDFKIDWSGIESACDDNTHLIFFCSPNNPSGSLVDPEALIEFANRRGNRSIIVVDEAYVEFSGRESLIAQIGKIENLVVLRTFSKAFALAGARCGAVVSTPEITKLISAMMSPYAISAPVTEIMLEALQPNNQNAARKQISRIVAARDALAKELAKIDQITRVWASFTNFLLVKFASSSIVCRSLEKQKIMIREFQGVATLENCARITVGSTSENDRLLNALRSIGAT